MIQSSIRGPNARVPIRRLFTKVFLWFWLTVLALFAIFLASRMLGTRLIPSTDVIASFAPRVADEAAHAYESGGPQEFEQFERAFKKLPRRDYARGNIPRRREIGSQDRLRLFRHGRSCPLDAISGRCRVQFLAWSR